MTIAKLLVLVVVVGAQNYATTPPNVRPPSDELREQRGSERALPYFNGLLGIVIWSWASLEGSVLFALSGYCPPSFAQPILAHLLPRAALPALTTLTPGFLAGACLTLAGTFLRAHCFRALGPRFTFELAIRPAHTLVTDGVYGVVRHPSYTGAVGIALGWLLCVFDKRGWAMGVLEGWVGRSVGRGVWAGVWAGALGFMCVVVSKRMDKEDAMLEEGFGETWRTWARRVPYRLIPGVY